jgi:myo-inositol-1-phosphate synthase
MTTQQPAQENAPVGVYLLGACGSVATLTVAGAHLVANGLAPGIGMISATRLFEATGLLQLEDFVFGGCDLRDMAAAHRIDDLIREHILPCEVRAQAILALERMPVTQLATIVPGGREAGDGLRLVDSMVAEFSRFRRERKVERLVVVNLSSTEQVSPLLDRLTAAASIEELDDLLENAGAPVPWGVIYAYAAIKAGCALVNFTPNLGTDLPALGRLALERGLPHAGKDGKTGETLLKTVLAPLFEQRALEVLTWHGVNILGNNDGQTLNDPAACAVKLHSKNAQLGTLLPGSPDLHARTAINYAPSLGDWKTAWDFIHFRGFLGVKMQLQFTWHGSDSALASPLVLDLIRFVEHAWRQGASGSMRHLCSYFKNPTGGNEHDFRRQIERLGSYYVDAAAG